ncbi:hypothetical protein [Streptomyces xantholiticus]|uniref:Uncharacterized protein n=1 Tax=Streptomyces xantholiticus TaxID=68285 RepID=A0ABV1UPQ2_9ACTN
MLVNRPLERPGSAVFRRAGGLRRLQYDRWAAREADPMERSAADTAALAARSEVIAAPSEVKLLTESSEVRERLAELADATFTLHQVSDEEDLATRSQRARAAADSVVATIGRRVRS